MKILIVEDQSGIADFLKQGLQEEGYQTIVAYDGESALERFNDFQPDLLLLDWMLPKMKGIDVCKKIRDKNTKTPIIFLTAKDTIEETIEGLKAGANDYIKKPFSFEELLLRIKIQLKGHDVETENYRLGTIVLNDKTHQVFNNDVEIILTQKEFLLLKYLIKNKGEICSRNQIIKDVWNIHFEYDTSVIDVFMNAIRKKLNLKTEQDYIKTVRGVGYIAND
jgi:two-component system response regulator ArlR